MKNSLKFLALVVSLAAFGTGCSDDSACVAACENGNSLDCGITVDGCEGLCDLADAAGGGDESVYECQEAATDCDAYNACSQ